jgi:hypothetical protein
MLRLLMSSVVAMMLLGCDGYGDLKALRAIEPLQAYSSPEGEKSFVIGKGQVCAAGGTEYAKSFAYVKVLCPENGVGWVVLGDPYIHYDSENPNGVAKK